MYGIQIKSPPKRYIRSSGMKFSLPVKNYFLKEIASFLSMDMSLQKNIVFQMGYICQFDYKINDETGIDFFHLFLLYNFDLTKTKHNGFTPSTSD